MFTLSIPLCTLLLVYFTAGVAQPAYKPTDRIFVDCGSSTNSTSSSNQTWEGDEISKFVPSDFTTTSFSFKTSSQDASVDTIPYSTARVINTSSFTYIFPVSPGPKFLRLHFYPFTSTNYIFSVDTKNSFFSVSSNGYSLLTNFSAFLHVSFQNETRPDAKLVKEFLIHVNNTQTLNVVFTPSPNSYAFINGIEIISMPDNLYFNTAIKPKPIGMVTGPITDNQTALENTYRLNMGERRISVKYDTGMYRFWDQDDNYIYGAWYGETPLNTTPITHTPEIPSYTAPEQVYETQRSMGKLADQYNLTMVKGSIGYIDPEYRKSQHLRQKSDVYSFGVVLFEVLCARPVIDPWVSAEQVSLAEWGKICYQRGTLSEISDPNISGEVAVECLKKFGEVANSCLHEEGNVRPAMEEVVYGLECALQLQVAAEEMVIGSVDKEIMQEKQNGKEDEGNVALAKVSLNDGGSEEPLVIELSTTLSS